MRYIEHLSRNNKTIDAPDQVMQFLGNILQLRIERATRLDGIGVHLDSTLQEA